MTKSVYYFVACALSLTTGIIFVEAFKLSETGSDRRLLLDGAKSKNITVQTITADCARDGDWAGTDHFIFIHLHVLNRQNKLVKGEKQLLGGLSSFLSLSERIGRFGTGDNDLFYLTPMRAPRVCGATISYERNPLVKSGDHLWRPVFIKLKVADKPVAIYGNRDDIDCSRGWWDVEMGPVVPMTMIAKHRDCP